MPSLNIAITEIVMTIITVIAGPKSPIRESYNALLIALPFNLCSIFYNVELEAKGLHDLLHRIKRRISCRW